MQLSAFQKIALGVSGVTTLAIGGFILFAPHMFYASYGIALDRDPNLMSELRAPGAGLAALGAIMLSGLLRVAAVPVAVVAALTVFLAFPFGRLVSIGLDGVPSGSILGALAIECGIAVLLLVAFRPPHDPLRQTERIADLPG